MPDESLEVRVHRICWIDLATIDQGAAKSFYRRLFGWTAQDRRVGEGHLSTFASREIPLASVYQLSRKQIAHGVPSHWTPYVSVPDLDAAASMAAGLGGRVVIPPHDSGGLARISLVADPTGALIGLWQLTRETSSPYPCHDP
jgi:predicted enzyme related to lactoylglutathione lyase